MWQCIIIMLQSFYMEIPLHNIVDIWELTDSIFFDRKIFDETAILLPFEDYLFGTQSQLFPTNNENILNEWLCCSSLQTFL